MANKFFERLSSELHRVRIPTENDKIYKDECVFSFDTPETDTGLYICLNTFIGMGQFYTERFYRRTRNAVYLHILRERIDITNKIPGDGPEKKVTRLAIGVEGGFDADSDKRKFEIKETINIAIMPENLICPWPATDLPDKLIASVKGVLSAESASKIAEKEALTGTWDGEVRIITKHADSLLQLDNGKKIPPSGWKCEKCDLDNNLWLNLTDGSILCGRQFFDGSGGNDHAVKHYSATGYPLAVKLGTITKEGKADVFSYDEDDMVEDPNLAKHLAHFGINVTQMEKTDKSMVELELDLNQRVGEWAAIQENNSPLKPVYGPAFTGMVNLGNSCYLNSIMQVVFTIPDFVTRYIEGALEIFDTDNNDPANDFNIQMAKLGTGLMSGKYSKKPPVGSEDVYPKGITPLMFKTLIGKGHADFSTKKQQDAQEFFLHLITMIQRNSRHMQDPSDAFKFQVEDRFECSASHKVKYTYRTEYCLPLPIPLEAAINKNEIANWEAKKAEAETKGQRVDISLMVRPRIKLLSCLEVFSQVENVEQFYSTAINAKTTAYKTTRLSSFPDYLMLHLKKFTLREDWVPVKLDVSIEMPDMIDLASLRGGGLQPGEESLPELQGSPPPLHLDSNILSTLVDMGFPVEAAKKAVYFTESSGIEQATNWVMEHIGDSDFLEPFVPPGVGKVNTGSDQAPFIPNEGAVFMLTGMGFTRAQAEKALKATDNNVERAADWIFSHSAELDDQGEEMTNNQTPPATIFRDGASRYKLVAFISHMGTSTMVGHYVCHILKGKQWVIYNDEKISLSENPPKDLGYLYLYERERSSNECN